MVSLTVFQLGGNNVTILPAVIPSATIGTRYSLQFSQSDQPDPALPFTFSGTLPPGLAADPTGSLSGTPTVAGSYTFSVSTIITQRSVTITVKGLLTATVGTLPSAIVGTSYSRALQAINGTGALTWAVVGGATPPGITLSSQGVLSGIPTTAGTFQFSVTVTDAAQSTSTTTATLLVTTPALTLAALSFAPSPAGTAIGITLSVGGGTPPYRFTVGSGALPPGLTL